MQVGGESVDVNETSRTGCRPRNHND